MISMFPEVVEILKQTPQDDLESRKLCFHFLKAFGGNKPQMAEQFIPFLEGDLQSETPALRALAIKTLSSVACQSVMECCARNVVYMLQDADPFVRKSCAFACARIYEYSFEFAASRDLISHLNRLLTDENTTVVSSALAALVDITERTTQLKLSFDKTHVISLLESLSLCNSFSQSYVLNAVMNYVPEREDDAMELVDLTIPFLQHQDTGVVCNALKVIVYFCNYIKNPQDKIATLPRRIGNSLGSLLSKNAEVQFLVLRNVILLLLSKPSLIQLDVAMFFCHYSDTVYVKDTKLEIIYLLADEANIDAVLRELEEYATDVDVPMVRKAIRAMGNLAVKLESKSKECVNVLLSLLDHSIAYVAQEIAIVAKNILRRYPNQYIDLVRVLMENVELMDEPESKAAIAWMLGQHCKDIPHCETLLAGFVDSFLEDSTEVQNAVLTASVKQYLCFPKESEDLVLSVLKLVTEEANNPDLRQRGFFYWKLLSADKEYGDAARDVITFDLGIISAEAEKLDEVILEELELNIGTLASVYLKPVNHVFRLAKPKFLTASPALQKKRAPRLTSSSSLSLNTPASRFVGFQNEEKTATVTGSPTLSHFPDTGRLKMGSTGSFSGSSTDSHTGSRLSRKLSIARLGKKFKN